MAFFSTVGIIPVESHEAMCQGLRETVNRKSVGNESVPTSEIRCKYGYDDVIYDFCRLYMCWNSATSSISYFALKSIDTHRCALNPRVSCFVDVIIRWTGEMFYVEYWMYRFAWNARMQWHLTVNEGVSVASKGMCGNHDANPESKCHSTS